MKSSTSILTILLLIPVFLEVIDSDLLLVSIPGSPLSLGRLSFLIVGFINYSNFKSSFGSNRILGAFLLIQLGLIFGAVASNDISTNISRTIAMILMINSSFILASVWKNVGIQRLLHFFFLAIFIYWTVYIIGNVVSGNRLVAYSELFEDQTVVNHHISGMKASISGIYLFQYFLKGKMKYRNWAYFIFFLTVMLCVLSESRSNTVFTILVGVIIIYRHIKSSRNLFITGVSIVLIALPIVNYLGNQEAIANRFDVSDTDYQQRTTESRFVLIEYSMERIFISAPLGSGITDIKLEYDMFRNFLVHNQYLSFSIAGGVVAFVGVLIWFSAIFRLFNLLRNFRLRNAVGAVDISLAYSLLAFYITLFTVDFSGLLFFVFLSIFTMLYRKLNVLNVYLK